MDDKERFEVYERVHLRKHEDLPDDEKIDKLKNKHRSKWIQVGYRPFPEWVYYILAFIFVLNVVLLYWQKNQIEALADYLKQQLDSESSLS